MKIKKYFLLIFIAWAVLACETASSLKSPSKNYFLKYYGEDGNQFAVDLIVNADGTFYILGNSVSPSDQNQEVYLVKADEQGNMIGNAVTISSTGSLEAKDFQVVGDSIIIVGNEIYSGNRNRIFLARLPLSDMSVYKINNYRLKSDSSKNVFANTLTPLSDGGYIISGSTDYVPSNHPEYSSSALHIRLDNSLAQRWENGSTPWYETTADGIDNNLARTIAAPNDTTFYSFGSTTSGGFDLNFWTFALSSHAVTTNNTDNSPFNEFIINGSDEKVNDVIKISPGGYLMTGVSISSTQAMSVIVKKLKQDQLTFDQVSGQSDVAYTFQSESLGQPTSSSAQYATACQNYSASAFFILSNTYNTSSGASDIYLQKLDLELEKPKLESTWQNPVTFGGDGEDTAAAVAELPDGHIMVLGTMNIGDKPEQFKIVLLKLNSAGKLAD